MLDVIEKDALVNGRSKCTEIDFDEFGVMILFICDLVPIICEIILVERLFYASWINCNRFTLKIVYLILEVLPS